MAAPRVVDRDLGYRRIIRNLKQLGRLNAPAVFVGVRSGAGESADGTPLVLIAAVNEFGSSDGHVPERSFLRSTVDENRAAYMKLLERAAGRAVDKGRSAMRRELELVGAKVASDVQRKIVALKDPPNAPSTIAAKGSSSPLVDTGRLRQSIDFEVRGI
jgi:hypothetical protein